MSTRLPPYLPSACSARSEQLYITEHESSCARIDRHFAWLMAIQWVACVAAALWLAPLTWSGPHSGVHPHVWAAALLCGIVAAGPILLALVQPGRRATRFVIAAAQMLFSSLLIHLTGGRIETHFHIFGSLAFLSFYRDRCVLLIATLTCAADHFFRGSLWSLSVFGAVDVSTWRWLEHTAWIVFEDIFLFISVGRSIEELRSLCLHQAQLEVSNEITEEVVKERTARLLSSEARMRASLVTAPFATGTITSSMVRRRSSRRASEQTSSRRRCARGPGGRDRRRGRDQRRAGPDHWRRRGGRV